MGRVQDIRHQIEFLGDVALLGLLVAGSERVNRLVAVTKLTLFGGPTHTVYMQHTLRIS